MFAVWLVGVWDGDESGSDFGEKVKSDPRFQDVEVGFCSPLMDTGEVTKTLEEVAASKTPIEEAQEESGLNSHAYGTMLQAVNPETKENLPFARTALSPGSRPAAWNPNTSLKVMAGPVSDKALTTATANAATEE